MKSKLSRKTTHANTKQIKQEITNNKQEQSINQLQRNKQNSSSRANQSQTNQKGIYYKSSKQESIQTVISTSEIHI
ncbi:hypothetical protein TTHERM_000449749 (macronuclear) [Tetrahymena thermophila SB210]|uniref:Uncharacterized protein n=1 Tax=Tetrahymena thermophila (strain SB210) TaxID=312017 RepID=W7XCB9_TETTS|nr:hypothetical protein TTHERM_000449749 [Tetrahymena thermophila SB210]EWS75077.1 hypothetical protein TTHERM_000449749 [Tetrahymena thermophila SB210]|eukprot:XP_012652390.1 hypothetical protein TTHERM_000449749 [Tetrahymena thermophila SB210]